jgi:hypothetical protein
MVFGLPFMNSAIERSSPGCSALEEHARNPGPQTSTACTGRRGLAWANSFG